MERTEIVSLYKNTPADGTVVTVCGWAKNIRDSKNIGFIALSDGGCFKTLQVVLEAGKLANYEEVIHTGLYSSLRIVGRIVLTPQAKQPFELNADSVEILGDCPADEYPLQKKKMSMEYLRTMPTLRPRTNTFNAAFRVRSVAAYAIHKFFQENGFIYSHSPLLTASDCEGAGEMFQVTTLDLQNVPKNEDGTVDYSQDFFEKPVNLTVSGQLEAEAMAMAFGKVYTFGPTFRAEKSFTTRHAAEFWMIEPEMAFCDLKGYMDTAEAMTKFVIRYVLDNCPDEMAFFNQFIDKGLIERLELVANSEFIQKIFRRALAISCFIKFHHEQSHFKILPTLFPFQYMADMPYCQVQKGRCPSENRQRPYSSILCLLAQQRQHTGLGAGTHSLIHKLAVAEHQQGGDAHHAELGGQLGLFIHIDLAHLDIGALLGHLVHDGAQHPAGAAPGGPEVQQNRLCAVQHLGFKIFFGNGNNSHIDSLHFLSAPSAGAVSSFKRRSDSYLWL